MLFILSGGYVVLKKFLVSRFLFLYKYTLQTANFEWVICSFSDVANNTEFTTSQSLSLNGPQVNDIN